MFHIQENGDIRMLRLSQIAQLLNGYAFKSKNYADNGIRVIRIANVQDGYIVDDAPCFYPIDTDEDIEKYSLFAGDLLISLTGNVGRVGILPADMLPAALNQRVCCLRIDETIVDRKYLFYFLRQHQFMRDCVKASKGVAQLNLSTKWLADYEIPTPKIEEQKRIVARIEELFSELDNGVETLQKTKLQLAVYRQAVLRDAFAGLDTFVSLQSISERIFDGPFGSNLKTSDYTSSGIRVVRLENLKDGWFDDSKQSFVTQEKYDAISSHTVYPTDLIMSTFIADSIKVCRMPENIGFAVNKADCIGIRLKSNYVQRYVMYYLMTKNAYNSLVHEVHGATRPRVNTKQIKGIQIPMCDLSAQKQIVRNIESRLSVCDSIEKTVDAALQQAEAMRQSILKQAFEGRL